MVKVATLKFDIAFSVTNAVVLSSLKVESFDISFTEYPFKLNEPVISTEPVNSCLSSNVSPNSFEPVEKSTERVVICCINKSDVKLPVTVKSPTIIALCDVTNEPVSATLPLIPPSVNFVVPVPIFNSFAVNVLNCTSASVETSCPIDIVCDNGVEPSKLCPLLDNVTPVPCSNVNGLVIDILNTSFVASPNSAAFDDNFVISSKVLSVLSLMISFLGVKYFFVVFYLLKCIGKIYPFSVILNVVLINRSPST